MTCPVCTGKTLVSYSFADCETVFRKRTCRECGHIFYTTEWEDDKYEYLKQLSERDRKKYLRRKQERDRSLRILHR